jgi:hypothetical protein
LTAKTADEPYLIHNEETPLVVRGSFLRSLLLDELGNGLVPPNGIDIQGAQIVGDVDLRGCNVNYSISLRKCKFLGVLDLSGAAFVKLVLTGTSVERLCLSDCTCSGSVILSYGFRTLHPVVARGAKIGGQLGCSGGQFLGYPIAISIEAAEIQEALFWRQVKDLWGTVDFTNARVGCLVDDPDSWPSKGNLRLAGFEYGSIESNTSIVYFDRLDWLERQHEPHLTDDFRPQPFEQLVKVLKATGREEEATKVAIRKLHYQRDANFLRRNRRVTELSHQIRMSPLLRAVLSVKLEHQQKWSIDNFALFLIAGWRWLQAAIFWAVAGYGYRPSRCIFWAIILIVSGGALFAGLYENGNMVHVTQSLMSDISGEDVNFPTFYSTAYAADLFIPLVDLKQASNWALVDKPDGSMRPFLLFYWCYIFLGWVFAAIFAASVSGLVRK